MKKRMTILTAIALMIAIVVIGCGKAPKQASAAEQQNAKLQQQLMQINDQTAIIQKERDLLKQQSQNLSLAVDQLRTELEQIRNEALDTEPSAETQMQLDELVRTQQELQLQLDETTIERDAALEQVDQSEETILELQAMIEAATVKLEEYEQIFEELESQGIQEELDIIME